ncbi:LOW QUALITY PROTEIN: laminin subunit alpha-1-like [Nycticebus coucang]|uniref:LOW QUALITY PROTEIN: laminin subunit alpha-1-like n=1 Tax=Nycticebus coucang TaxID=9470 RepID=UPI00234D14C5|nr:LOW QUALITY PROTEIN: laminin subunit alpha-1-like [Nycticebus coucang]
MQKELAKFKLEGVAKETDDLQKKLTRVVTSSQKENKKTERIFKESWDLATFIDRLQRNIQETVEKATTLNQTLDEDFQLPSLMLENMQRNILSSLKTIQKRHFMQLYQNVTLELNGQLQAARTLVKDAEGKSQESDRLLLVASANLREFELFPDVVKTETPPTPCLSARESGRGMALLVERKVKDVETQANLLFDRLKPLKILEENLNTNLSEIKLLISQARKQAASVERFQGDKVVVLKELNLMSGVEHAYLSSALALQCRSGVEHAYLSSALALRCRSGVEHAYLSSALDLRCRSGVEHAYLSCALALRCRSGVEQAYLSCALALRCRSGVEHPYLSCALALQCRSGVEHTYLSSALALQCSSQNEDSSFHSDGSGYSLVEKTLRATVTQIIMLFSTFSPNGLLLYLASNGTKDFISIKLVHGRVKVTVYLGSGPLALITDRCYNNMTWYKIAFQRNRKQALLAVITYNTSYKETKQGETLGVSSDRNHLDKDPIYVGGLPRSRVVREGITSKSYVGCIKNLEISRSTFDLLRNSYGARKGCMLEPIRSVILLRGSYVELPSKSLTPELELLAIFATKNSNGIILAALGRDAELQGPGQAHVPFFSILLIQGHVEVHISLGDRSSLRKALLHSPTGTYSDGQPHSISLVRNQRIITVKLDETNPVEINLGPLAESRTINVSNLYIGGIPEGEGTSVLRMRARSFHGCIRNLIFNLELLDFTSAVGSEQVDLDTCLLAQRPKLAFLGKDGECLPEPQVFPEQCAVYAPLEYVPGTHQFGLTQSSHVALPFNKSGIRKSGLVYYVAHQNQVDYATLQLHGGHLYFIFDLDKGRTKVSHLALLSDGKWHTLLLLQFDLIVLCLNLLHLEKQLVHWLTS